MGDDLTVPKVGVQIPYLFYDLIARVVPGAFFILGTLFSLGRYGALYCFTATLKCSVSRETSGALLVALLGIGVFAFLGVSSFVGFLLLSPSHLIVERSFGRSLKLDGEGLKKFLGSKDISELLKRFQRDFGFELPLKAGDLNRASFLCAYTLWIKAPNLGAMSGRFDADLAACQSTILVSVVLILEVVLRGVLREFESRDLGWLIALVLVLSASLSTFEYLRRKRVYGRFALYLSLGDLSEKTESESSNPNPGSSKNLDSDKNSQAQ